MAWHVMNIFRWWWQIIGVICITFAETYVTHCRLKPVESRIIFSLAFRHPSHDLNSPMNIQLSLREAWAMNHKAADTLFLRCSNDNVTSLASFRVALRQYQHGFQLKLCHFTVHVFLSLTILVKFVMRCIINRTFSLFRGRRGPCAMWISMSTSTRKLFDRARALVKEGCSIGTSKISNRQPSRN